MNILQKAICQIPVDSFVDNDSFELGVVDGDHGANAFLDDARVAFVPPEKV